MVSARTCWENDLDLDEIKGSDASPPKRFHDGALMDFFMGAEIDMDPCVKCYLDTWIMYLI